MPLRPAQTFNLAVASIALALIAEGATLWKVGLYQDAHAPAPVAATGSPTGIAPAPLPLFITPGTGSAPAAPQRPAGGSPGLGITPSKLGGVPADKRELAKSYFDAATAALAKKDNAAALASFLEVLEIAPDNVATRLNLAMLYLQDKKPDQAITQLQKVAQLDPKNAAARFQLAQTLVGVKRPADAIAPLREVLKLTPKEGAPREMLSQIYLSQKQPQKAYALWTAQAQSDPHDVTAHLQAAALAADALKRPAEAEKWLRSAQQGEPKDPRSALLLGRLLMAENKPKAAAQVLGSAAKARPDVFEIFPMLANARLASGDLNGARGAIESALLRLPVAKNDAQKAQVGQIEGGLRFTLGRVLGQSKKPKDALAEFQRAAVLAPKDPEVRSMLALAAAQSGDRKTAIAATQAALSIDPKRPSDHRLLAQLYLDQKNWEAANGQYEDYLSLVPRDGGALAEWAQAAHRNKKTDQELKIWRMLAALEPKNPLPYLQSAATLRQAKRPQEALDSFQQALALNPKTPNVLFEIGRLQTQLKKSTDATGTWEKFIALAPDFPPAYQALLESSAASGETSSARLFLARQLAKNENPKVLGQILAYYGKNKNDAEAKALLSDIVKRNPKSKSAKAALDSYDTPVVPTPEPKATPTITAPTPEGAVKGP